MRGYLTAGLAIALAVASLAVFTLWNRLGAAHEENSRLEAKVTLWIDAAGVCSNAALKAKESADKASEAALAALGQARKGADGAKREADRLRALMGAKTVTSCPAAEAVVAIRSGLDR